MIALSIDTESTGLNRHVCDILEFGAVLCDLDNPKFSAEELANMSVLEAAMKIPMFHGYFLPPDGKTVFSGEPFALSMHPHIFKRIATKEKGYDYFSPSRFGNSFKQFLIKNGFVPEDDRITINVVGKNVAWDISLLEEKTDIRKHVKCRHRVIDPSILYIQDGDTEVPGTQTCMLRSGLFKNRVVSHNALDDALDTLILCLHKWKK